MMVMLLLLVTSLVTDCARVRSLGVLIGESEGDFGESGKSERCAGYLDVFVGEE